MHFLFHQPCLSFLTGSWSRPGDHLALPVHAAAVPGTTVKGAPAFHGAHLGAGGLVDNIGAARGVTALGRYTLQIVRTGSGISGRLRGWRSIPRPCCTPGKEDDENHQNKGYQPYVSSHG